MRTSDLHELPLDRKDPATSPNFVTRNRMMLFLQAWFEANPDTAPTYREIGAAVGLSENSLQNVGIQLRRLRDQGFVTFVDGKQNSLRLAKPYAGTPEALMKAERRRPLRFRNRY